MKTGKPCCLTRQQSPERFSEDVQHKPDCLTTDVRDLQLRILVVEVFCSVYVAKKLRGTACLACAFLFAYAKSNFLHFVITILCGEDT